ncbi:hypothetical protein F5148DRAFT_1236727 [Russula earlei]|uniref:Uncharacterized protein n=1 Tax=Russula earlei TaxID=71964 RepID=A0ACC0TYV3_9AGAM|nr:hypothetical protein F5148DRAFT_1236727 [Russula earlei]
MRIFSVCATISCLAIGIAPSFALRSRSNSDSNSKLLEAHRNLATHASNLAKIVEQPPNSSQGTKHPLKKLSENFLRSQVKWEELLGQQPETSKGGESDAASEGTVRGRRSSLRGKDRG